MKLGRFYGCPFKGCPAFFDITERGAELWKFHVFTEHLGQPPQSLSDQRENSP